MLPAICTAPAWDTVGSDKLCCLHYVLSVLYKIHERKKWPGVILHWINAIAFISSRQRSILKKSIKEKIYIQWIHAS